MNDFSNDVLELPISCFDNPTFVDTRIVEAYMIWPTDTAARNRAIHTARVQCQVPDLPDFDADRLQMHAYFAREAMPTEFIKREAYIPYNYGHLAGIILKHVVEQVALDRTSEKAKMEWIIDNVSKTVFPALRLRPYTIRNTLWPNFRKVSHMWAAYIFRRRFR